ncbi:MAG: alpha/beta hydrolase family protein [Candidatus Hodarchaeales archaeon]|jgi:cephalosporin-C deacetylase-like acetyl esterase
MDLKMFEYDKLSSPVIKDVTLPREVDNVIIRDINFDSPKGGTISAYLVYPSEDGLYPGVFFTHWLETQAQDSNRTQFLDMAIEIGKRGAISILVDAFWSTTPEKWAKKWAEDPSYQWKTEYINDRDLSIKQTVELLRSFDVLLDQPNLDKTRIAYVGHDFGAMYGTLLTNFNLPIKTWVLIAGTSSFSEWFKFGSKLSPEEFQEYVEQMSEFNPAKHVARAEPAPVLFQFAKNDSYVPKEKAFEFFKGAKEPKEIHWYDANHGMNQQTFEDTKNWLVEKLSI